jgi:hypothetical protein
MTNSIGSLVNSSLDLSKKAKKLLFSIKAYTSDFGQIPVKVAWSQFDTLVKPILTYNSEISLMDSYLKLFREALCAEKNNSEIDELKFINKTAIEKVHLGFCKSTLGVKMSSTNLAVRAELGQLPLESLVKTQPSLYLLRLNSDNIKPLLKEAFHLSKMFYKNVTFDLKIAPCDQGCLNSIIDLREKQCTEVHTYKNTHRDKTVNVDKIKHIFIVFVQNQCLDNRNML